MEECGREVEMNRLAALCRRHERKACSERHVCLRYERELCQTQSCCWNWHVNLFVALSCDIGAGLVLVYWFFPVLKTGMPLSQYDWYVSRSFWLGEDL